MSAEVKVAAEGSLWWVQASGVGTGMATASAPQSGLLAYIDQFTFNSGRTLQAQMDRGVPKHWKEVDKQPISVNFTVRWTGDTPVPASGSGASMPMMHLEYNAIERENDNNKIFYQFFGVPIQTLAFTENANGNTQAYTTQALAMNGPTGSGYLSN